MRVSSLLLAGMVVVTAWSCDQYNQFKASVSSDFARISKPSGSAGADTPWQHDDGADGGATLADDLTGACFLQKHEDNYFGFTIGRPTGWVIDYSTGSILVAKDERELEGALVYPARLRKEMPAEDIATAFARGLGASITKKGGTFEMSDKHTNGKIAQATLKATVGGVALRGPLQVVVKPGFAVIKLYWAPESEFDAEQATLKQVLTCFQRKTVIMAKKPVAPSGGPVMRVGGKPGGAAPAVASAGSSGTAGGTAPSGTGTGGASGGGTVEALVPNNGKFFNVSLPAGWKFTDENEHGIDMLSPDGKEGAGFGYGIQPIKTAQVYCEGNIRGNWPGSNIIQGGPVQGPAGWSIYGAEFEGKPHGLPTHGYQQAAVGHGTFIFSGYTTAPEKWDASKATLGAIIASVQILPAATAKIHADYRAQLASYPHYTPPASNYPSNAAKSGSSSDSLMASWKEKQDAQDRINLGFDDAIRGQDRALSPTTGEEYVCPNSMWSTEGPQGPGYYRQTPSGGTELLNVEPNAGGSAPL
jgi:hypothetical protein